MCLALTVVLVTRMNASLVSTTSIWEMKPHPRHVRVGWRCNLWCKRKYWRNNQLTVICCCAILCSVLIMVIQWLCLIHSLSTEFAFVNTWYLSLMHQQERASVNFKLIVVLKGEKILGKAMVGMTTGRKILFFEQHLETWSMCCIFQTTAIPYLEKASTHPW